MANNDNVMARFLFAILEQKCLKDIDWNKVARNPVLAQPITNGHAARMRFSRFRSAVLGLEPQRRNRVSKKKKDEAAKKPKKEDEGLSSGSGIGNIKAENKTEAAANVAVKAEQNSISHLPPDPPQPPASMEVPKIVKMEPNTADAHCQAQIIRQPSVLCVASPRIKQETLPATSADTVGPVSVSVPEPAAAGILTTNNPAAAVATTASASPTPYMDSYHHMPLRLPTPCSDTDGVPGFLRHSPPPASDFLHSQRPYPHHHHMVGAGSPPLSTTASSPYDFAQCLDTVPSPAGSSSPWQSQQHHHHPNHFHPHHHSQSLSHGHCYNLSHQHTQPPGQPMFTLPVDLTLAPAAAAVGGYSAGYATFCGDQQQQQQQQHHQQQQRYQPLHGGCDEDAHGEVDSTHVLGIHCGAAGLFGREPALGAVQQAGSPSPGQGQGRGQGQGHGGGLRLGLGLGVGERRGTASMHASWVGDGNEV